MHVGGAGGGSSDVWYFCGAIYDVVTYFLLFYFVALYCMVWFGHENRHSLFGSRGGARPGESDGKAGPN